MSIILDTTYVGIDPGKSGGMAIIFNDGTTMTWPTPVVVTRKKRPRKKTASGKASVTTTTDYNLNMMYKLLAEAWTHSRHRHTGVVKAVIEIQRPRMNDGKGRVFVSGMGYGHWIMGCSIARLPLEYVSPNVWRPKYLPKGADKKEALVLARKLFPDADLPLAKDEGRAEALLIADYQRRCDYELGFLRD